MNGQKGYLLVEVLVALALLGVIGAAFLSGLGTVAKSTASTNEREIGRNVAQSQVEYVQGLAYAPSYVPALIPPEYTGYSAVIEAVPLDDPNIQQVTVTVRHQDNVVAVLESYRAR
jgi:prepilin-type N-terminal cleavage/methylation domain-containing protein